MIWTSCCCYRLPSKVRVRDASLKVISGQLGTSKNIHTNIHTTEQTRNMTGMTLHVQGPVE
jgi:hypothetical protein